MHVSDFHRVVLLLFFSVQAGGVALQSSRILDEKVSPTDSQRKVGDGPGRPLYHFSAVEVPENLQEEGASGCVALTMEASTNALQTHSYGFGGEADSDYIAKACFTDSLATSGWNHLNVSTTDDKEIPLAVRAYSAGVVEGLLTSRQIGAFGKTVSSLLQKDTASAGNGGAAAAVDRVLRMSLIAWEELTGGDATSPPKDDIVRQAWATLIQLRGIRDGHNMLASTSNSPQLSMYEMLLMNMHAELPTIVDLYGRSEQAKIFTSLLQMGSHTQRLGHISPDAHTTVDKDFEAMDDEGEDNARESSWARWSSHMPQGSALVKRVGPDGTPEDMLTGHVTHGNYGEMLRIMKTYQTHFDTPVTKITMSSYPGCVSSTDDYMITDKGFVLMSTNLWLPKSGEFGWPSKTNEGLPCFLRSSIATRLATHPRIWAKIYGFLTGIAGAKQWLITDYSKFKGQQPITNETVFLVEAMPRLLRLGDVSTTLRTNGFFEVHGTPHFRQIREIFGLPPLGEGSYKEHLRSALLDKAATVDSLPMARAMLAEVTPARTPIGSGIWQKPITSRNDLAATRPVPEGGIDAKVTSRCMVKALRLQAISGPPSSSESHSEPFDWNVFKDDWPRNGLPQKWAFTWINAGENGITAPVDDSQATCENPEIEESGSNEGD